MRHCKLILVLSLVLPMQARAQSSCPNLPAPSIPANANMFTGQQESELGEIIRQQAEREFRVIDEERLTGFVKTIGARIISKLPDIGLKYQFSLYDQPEIQAFGMPGGHIYISRKMVAFLKSEDELAGLLGHELGHMVARQPAIEMSHSFRDVLGVKSISSDDDLFERYNSFIENVERKTHHAKPIGNSEKGQEVADQLGVQAVARAGYAPQAFPALMDRLMETKGNTGSWLSDLFGNTRPDSRRLRESLRDVASLPPACIEKRAPTAGDEFHEWQAAVLRYQGIGHSEHLPKVFSRVSLKEPLRGNLRTLRFSSDGKFLLAQDDGSVYVATREPFNFVFSIDAPDAGPAQFSPDARHVVFFNRSFRVETWDVERQEQVSVTDVPARHVCLNTALSADAHYLACFAGNMALLVYDVETGEIVLQVDNFFNPEGNLMHYNFLSIMFFASHNNLATMCFSPDGHYFVASSRTDQQVAFDLVARHKMALPGNLRTAVSYAFTFVGQDRIVGVDTNHPDKSPVLEFPSGKVVDHIQLGGDSLRPTTDPRYFLAGPLKDRPIGAFDLQKKALVFGNRSDAVDIWNDVAISERLNGEVGLYHVGESKPTAVMTPPLGKLGTLKSFAASPDLRWIAMSGESRGGEWDLEKNARVILTRGFRTSAFGPNSKLLLDFPKFEKNERAVVVWIAGMKDPVRDVSVGEHDAVEFVGNTYLRMRAREDKPALTGIVLEARDATTDQQAWSRSFPKHGPGVFVSAAGQRLIFSWSSKNDGVRDEIANHKQLLDRWKDVKLKEGDMFAEAVNAATGEPVGGVVIHTGNYSFDPEDVDTVGDSVMVSDNRNRVLIYSLASGELKTRIFGSRPRISRDGARLAITNGRGQLALYDLRSLKQTAEFSFSASVSFQEFSADGTKLLVLTDDQTAFVIDATSTDLN